MIPIGYIYKLARSQGHSWGRPELPRKWDARAQVFTDEHEITLFRERLVVFKKEELILDKTYETEEEAEEVFIRWWKRIM